MFIFFAVEGILFFLISGCILPLHTFAQSPLPANPTASFLYRSEGQRIMKREADGTTTYYLSPYLEVTVSPGGQYAWKKYYAYQGRLSAVRSSDSSLTYIHPDHLSSTSLATDQSGAVIYQQNYYPYGLTRNTDGPPPTEHQYTSQVSDQEETGLYYYNSRYYDPKLGKFIQADIEQGPNRYAYVNNNPISNIDPSGNQVLPINLPQIPGYDDQVFDELYNQFINIYLYGLPRGYQQWQSGDNLSRVNTLMNYVYEKIPYSAVNDRYDRAQEHLYDQHNQFADLSSQWSSLQAISPGIYRSLQKMNNVILSIIETTGERFDRTAGRVLTQLQNQLTPAERLKNDLFVCKEKTSLLYNWINQNTDLTTAFTSVAMGTDKFTRHDFVIYYNPQDNLLYVADPTYNLNQTLYQYMKDHPQFDWEYPDFPYVRGAGAALTWVDFQRLYYGIYYQIYNHSK